MEVGGGATSCEAGNLGQRPWLGSAWPGSDTRGQGQHSRTSPAMRFLSIWLMIECDYASLQYPSAPAETVHQLLLRADRLGPYVLYVYICLGCYLEPRMHCIVLLGL